MPAQELNLFCTLCTTLFALGCLVLSIINGALQAVCQTLAEQVQDRLEGCLVSYY